MKTKTHTHHIIANKFALMKNYEFLIWILLIAKAALNFGLYIGILVCVQRIKSMCASPLIKIFEYLSLFV
jgi:hypothetical protein